MRLAILNNGHSIGTKLLFGLIQVFSRQPVLDVVKLVKYRPEFYGKPMGAITQEAMRGPSKWSIGERELMAAVVANANESVWCTQAHTAVARQAYGERLNPLAVITDLESAPIDMSLREMLRLLRKLTRERSVNQHEIRVVLATGVTREQIEDALSICFAFNVVGRLAEAFGFSDPGAKGFEAGAKYLIERGYR